MAIIRNLASMMLKGKIGDTTYYVSQSRQLARQALNNSNYGETASRTDVQQSRRVRWANLVNFYTGNKGWMKKAFEGLKPGVSIFNRFIQLNINAAQVALTKSEAQAKLWVPAAYRISQGSLRTLGAQLFNGDMIAPTVNISLEHSADLTVGAVSQSLIADNADFANGDAIVCVIFAGTTGAPGATSGMAVATYKYVEFVLDVEDSTLMSSKYGEWLLVDGRFLHEATSGVGAAVYIHTRKSGGKLYVSTEDIFVTEGVSAGTQGWHSEAQIARAIASYGESTNVPLAPGGNSSQQSGNDSSSGGGSGSLE